MSIVIKFFVAPDRDAAAAVVGGGPDGVFESLTYGNFDAEEALIEWESIFTGRSFEELVAADEPEVIADPGDGEGPLVLAVSRTVKDALAGADELRLGEVGRLWLQERAEDGEVLDQQTAAGILRALAGLARAVGGREDRLYCWMA
ncbi:hypothetical protein Kpho02_69850 [Kitasatospora phosalacinea]|uniref:DUF1877 family protein n=1 Tax=Kitasatospora phosalacinea TaxID=2065 RepID=A0A9W6V5V9_9ACTN|nr:hypothetical protein [Kitasatospora phosalacinea]GLW74688.1 hypothetical protein Kpho02_69850 [Kitasatospora phosalacinea]